MSCSCCSNLEFVRKSWSKLIVQLISFHWNYNMNWSEIQSFDSNFFECNVYYCKLQVNVVLHVGKHFLKILKLWRREWVPIPGCEKFSTFTARVWTALVGSGPSEQSDLASPSPSWTWTWLANPYVWTAFGVFGGGYSPFPIKWKHIEFFAQISRKWKEK